jgi:hypothetical protein
MHVGITGESARGEAMFTVNSQDLRAFGFRFFNHFIKDFLNI